MWVNVTPADFFQLQELATDFVDTEYMVRDTKRILEYCAKEYGGEYSYHKHIRGESVEIKVVYK